LDQAFERSKEEFAKHFRSKYEGPPPLWIAAGTWDWGNLSYMLGYLSEKNRDAICRAIDPRLTRKSLASWMKCLNDVRNACAHHSRLWNKPLINSPRLKPNEIGEFKCLLDERGRVPDANSKRLYGALVVMIFLMRSFYPKTKWPVRLCELILEAERPNEINSVTAGFPQNWHQADIWQTPSV
jgi:abortive infection bacteriophage resistance protein